MAEPLQIDVAIFGGGIAGLWTLDHLVRSGYHAVLIESDCLGAGQTIASQGIIHGGLKYTLDGLLNPSAEAIRDMPAIWRDCLKGKRNPNLTTVEPRAEFCHLWRTSGLRSQIGMLGARVGLRVKPEKLSPAEWPAALNGLRGEVFRLPEQVIDPAQVLRALAAPHQSRLLKAETPPVFRRVSDDSEISILLRTAASRELALSARRVVLAAGSGNGPLRRQLGLSKENMQLRPLHMVMVRGPLPPLNGHCTDASTTRVTITTVRGGDGTSVWQIGGQLAEDGVKMDRNALILHARRELSVTVPGANFDHTLWSTYRVDRAEPQTNDGRRPNDAWCRADGSVITAWPTKLALAPRLADQIADLLPAPGGANQSELPEWRRPEIALPPWELEQEWSHAS